MKTFTIEQSLLQIAISLKCVSYDTHYDREHNIIIDYRINQARFEAFGNGFELILKNGNLIAIQDIYLTQYNLSQVGVFTKGANGVCGL